MKRILLARALLNKPNLLILDEPTQGVDIHGQIDLYNLIDKLRIELNCGVLLVSHNLHLIMEKKHKIICLNKNICCFGTPEYLLSNHKFILLFGHDVIKKLKVFLNNHSNIAHNFFKKSK